MAQLAILGHPTRANEVIEILEMLGGKNAHNLYGDESYAYYTIENDKEIKGGIYLFGDEEVVSFTLEEFLKKFPYKVGDKILYKTYGIYSKIKTMLWNVEKEQVFYRLESNKLFVATADELKPYKEETMEKQAIPPYMDYDVRTEETMEIKIDIPKGYEFAGIDDDKQQVVFEKIGYHYPKTYEKCCDVLNTPNDERYIDIDVPLDYNKLLYTFTKLLICRNAYWKIAGDWKPDWTNKDQPKFVISIVNEKIKFNEYYFEQKILTFPTAEMRDAFYENFKELIEKCKEFL